MGRIIQPIGDRIIIPKRKIWMGLEDHFPARIFNPRLSKKSILTAGSNPTGGFGESGGVSLIFNETFEGAGYVEDAGGATGGWGETLGSGGTPEITEDFDTASVPGGAPTGWDSQCLKMVLGTTEPTLDTIAWNVAKGTLYFRFDLVVGSFGGLTENNHHIVRTHSASNYPWSVDINNTGGHEYLRCWYNNGADWQGPIGNYHIELNTPYRIDVKWIKATDSTGVEFCVSTTTSRGASLGTGTSGNIDITNHVFGDDGTGLVAMELYFDNVQAATEGWCP